MMVNPPPHRDDDDDFHHAASLLELALSYWQSRRLARRYVRQGVHPSVAASRAVDSMMMLSALGAVIILWGILAIWPWSARRRLGGIREDAARGVALSGRKKPIRRAQIRQV